MTGSSTSAASDRHRVKGLFHLLLVLFAAPARLPIVVIYLVAGAIALGIASLWRVQLTPPANGLIMFMMMAAFFAADRDLLVSLPRRGISFGAWQSQLFGLLLPRTAVALVFGLLVPRFGWSAAFYGNVAVQFLGSIALYRGAIWEPRQLELTEHTVMCDRLPPDTLPLRILHISDLHIERLGVRETRLLELIQSAKPDIILLTGDYVNISNIADPLAHEDIRRLLGKIDAPFGIFAVMGSPSVDKPDMIAPLFEEVPPRLLRDESLMVTGPQGQAIRIIGVDCHHNIEKDAEALDDVLGSLSGDNPRILLYHSPELMPQAATHEIDLYLCGHTHGGQVRLPLIGPLVTSSKLGRRYVMGLYREGRTHLYVSRGVGFEGLGAPRVRLLCPPEITLILLAPGN